MTAVEKKGSHKFGRTWRPVSSRGKYLPLGGNPSISDWALKLYRRHIRRARAAAESRSSESND